LVTTLYIPKNTSARIDQKTD